MRLTVGSVQISARDVKSVTGPPFLELNIDGTDVVVSDSGDGKLWVRSATGTVVITEAAVNAAITAARVDRIRGLELKTYNGFVRIVGKYEVLGAMAVSFTVEAVPEIESGARLRLAIRSVNVAGAVSLPSFVVDMLAAQINEQLGKVFDASRLPVPIRLTGVKAEPGRITLAAKLEMPPETAPKLIEGAPCYNSRQGER